MEQQIQVNVLDVASRQATRKADGAKFTLYDVRLSDGETYTTSRRDVAEQAHALTGQSVVATIKIEQNGVYTNRYLNAVQGTGFGAPAPGQFPPAAAPAASAIPVNTGSSDNDEKIYRQVAAKVSANLSTTESEFWGNVDALVHYFKTGEKPIASGSFASTPPPTDDIPF